MTISGPLLTGIPLEEALDQVPVALIVVEAPSGRIIHTNARARQMTERQLGRDVPEAVEDEWEIFHPDGRPYQMSEWPLVRSITTGEEVVEEEYFNLLPDGSRLIVRCSSSPIYDDTRTIVAAALVMEDITEQRRSQEKLAYHAGLLDVVEDAVVGTDADFRVTVWNRGAERLYGFPASEVMGRHAREVATFDGDDSRRRVESDLLDAARTRTEFTARRKDGTSIEVELIAVAVRGEDGEVTGYVGIHRDITARKRAEREREDRLALESLTPREREVLQALGQGLGSRAIAAHLNITIRTERNHVASILAKLGVHSQLQAVVLALRHDAIQLR
jgi:PAS domain S-box-containing protein